MSEVATTAPAYQVRDYVDVGLLKKDLAYSPVNLSDAMMAQASTFSHYGVQHALASQQVDVIKLLLEQTEAAIYQLLRSKAANQGDKLTETQLEKAVSREERVIGMKKALIEAKRIEATAKTAVEAFRHRKDMLIQAGFTAREEMKGELRIMGPSLHAQAQDAAYEAQKERMRQNAARFSAGEVN